MNGSKNVEMLWTQNYCTKCIAERKKYYCTQHQSLSSCSMFISNMLKCCNRKGLSQAMYQGLAQAYLSSRHCGTCIASYLVEIRISVYMQVAQELLLQVYCRNVIIVNPFWLERIMKCLDLSFPYKEYKECTEIKRPSACFGTFRGKIY